MQAHIPFTTPRTYPWRGMVRRGDVCVNAVFDTLLCLCFPTSFSILRKVRRSYTSLDCLPSSSSHTTPSSSLLVPLPLSFLSLSNPLLSGSLHRLSFYLPPIMQLICLLSYVVLDPSHLDIPSFDSLPSVFSPSTALQSLQMQGTSGHPLFCLASLRHRVYVSRDLRAASIRSRASSSTSLTSFLSPPTFSGLDTTSSFRFSKILLF